LEKNLKRKEMKRTILLVTIGVALFSCQTKKAILNSDYIQGNTYSGTLPCENCEGISQVVILDTGNTFRLSETYIGKDKKSVDKYGSWSVQDGKVMLYADNTNIAQYAVSGNKLVNLNATNFAAKDEKQFNRGMLARKNFIRSKKINPDYLEGIDIVAFGAEPSWSLDVHHKNAIQFSIPGLSAPIAFSPVAPILAGDSIIYNIISSNEKMRIVLSPGFCSDGISENLYDYKVSVSFRGNSYSGCGAILNADGNLTGTWLLDDISGEKNNWEKQPYIVVDLDEETFYANTGCNEISGSTRMRGEKVCFSDINYNSQKECEGYNEKSFIDAVIRCNGYTINQGKLSLTQDGNTVMTFTRHIKE
jgi:uncharacterized membrane protein/heat shock protein HslJ